MMEELRKQKDEELRQLRLEMFKSAEEYERKVDSLKVMYTGEIETMISTHKEQMKVRDIPFLQVLFILGFVSCYLLALCVFLVFIFWRLLNDKASSDGTKQL